jgi:anti-anti-sigma factor
VTIGKGPSVEPQIGVVVKRIDGMTTLYVSGEIDLSTRDQLRQPLGALDGTVIVDLAAVTFIDSSGIGVLAFQHGRLAEDGGRLTIREPSPIARHALEIVGMGEIIEDAAFSDCDG